MMPTAGLEEARGATGRTGMFVERSAARIQLVRTIFVCACLLPTLGLIGWAAYRRTSLYADPLLGAWSRSLGLAVAAGSVEHVRPSVVRLRGISLTDGRQHPLAAVLEAELEERSQGTLVRLPALTLDAAGVRAVAALSLAWLTEPVRFPRGGVIRIDAFSWNADTRAQPQGGFHVEYVVADGGRAIRIRREPADRDELRLRAVAAPDGLRLEAELICERGLPADLVSAATGWMPTFGPSATIRGHLSASAAGAGGGTPMRWNGAGDGVVSGVDLAGMAAVAGQMARGEAVLRIESLALQEGRITAARFLLSAEEGEVSRTLLERMVTVFGCRLGAAAGPVTAWEEWLAGPPLAFDDTALAVELDRDGVTLQAVGMSATTLAAWGGRSLLEAGGARVSYDRFAWLFAPTAIGTIPATIPASPRAIEVLSRLPVAAEDPRGRF